MEHILDLVFESVIQNATGLCSSDVFKLERSSISLMPEYKIKAKQIGLSKVLNPVPDGTMPF